MDTKIDINIKQCKKLWVLYSFLISIQVLCWKNLQIAQKIHPMKYFEYAILQLEIIRWSFKYYKTET